MATVGFFPQGVVADVFVAVGVTRAQAGAEVGHAQRVEDMLNQLDDALEFLEQLIGPDEKMGVIDGEAAHARQPAQLARLLVAIYRAELGVTQRQIAIRARLAGVNATVMRAIHGPQQEFVAVNIYWSVLAVGVKGVVARCLIEFDVAEMRRDYRQIAALDLNVAQPAFQRIAQGRAVRQPKRQALPTMLSTMKRSSFSPRTRWSRLTASASRRR